jgi:hypothetical protein
MRRFAREHAHISVEQQKETAGDRLSDEDAMNSALALPKVGST